jgi:hypothetical protein
MGIMATTKDIANGAVEEPQRIELEAEIIEIFRSSGYSRWMLTTVS